MTYKTRSIVLHKALFKESSFLVKLMTEDFGIISAIAQGARKNKSRFFSHFEVGNCLEIVFLSKNNSNLYTITDSSLFHCSDIENITYKQLISIQCVLELYNQLIITEDESKDFYALLLTFLDYIPTVKSNHLLVIWRFLFRLTELLGFPIDTSTLSPIPYPLSPKKWFDILPHTAKYINEANILDETCLIINKMILDWFESHLNKKLHCKAMKIYEEELRVDTIL